MERRTARTQNLEQSYQNNNLPNNYLDTNIEYGTAEYYKNVTMRAVDSNNYRNDSYRRNSASNQLAHSGKPLETSTSYANDFHQETQNLSTKNWTAYPTASSSSATLSSHSINDFHNKSQSYLRKNSKIYALQQDKISMKFIQYYNKSIKTLKQIFPNGWTKSKKSGGGFRDIVIDQEDDLVYGIFYMRPSKVLFRPKYSTDSCEHYLLLNGSCQIQIGQECKSYEQADLIQIDPNQVHSVFTNKKQEVVIGYVYSVMKEKLGCEDLKYSKDKRPASAITKSSSKRSDIYSDSQDSLATLVDPNHYDESEGDYENSEGYDQTKNRLKQACVNLTNSLGDNSTVGLKKHCVRRSSIF